MNLRIALLAFFAAAWWADCVRADAAGQFMVEVTLRRQQIEGMPLAWDAQRVHLLGRDGRLWQFAPDEPSRFQQTADRFRSYSPSELRAELLRELGPEFEVSGTSHYLVAHPRGQHDKWAQRLEDLYRSLVHYFSVRGFELQPPPFPLLGVVCRNQDEFARYAARQGSVVPSGVVGYYALDSNRIMLYDMGGKDGSNHWQQNAAVAIHEATHQTAFNTGIHSRYTPPPVWVAEGLAMLFEAPGVYDSRYHTRQSDRLNRERLEVFQKVLRPRHRPELLSAMVAADELFRVNPAAAYAEAWALSFFLVETMPGKYANYLARTVEHTPFREVTAAERTADFTAVFGSDWRMLEAQFLRFMAGLE
jgi:hypothetical protein